MATTATLTWTDREPTHVFERVLVDVDSSEASAETARQAAVLAEHYGSVKLLAAYPLALGVMGAELADDLDGVRAESERAMAAARAAISHLVAPETEIVRGFAWRGLIEESERISATLVAVAGHGLSRTYGIVSGATTTEILHKAPCSVLVARSAGESFPRRVVVGLDGSAESARAFTAARRIADRFGSELRSVVAGHGKAIDLAEVDRISGDAHEELPGHPVDALVSAAAEADLLVLGSRGLHGLKALGSVSEQVAHRAGCSTLIVREPREI